MHFASAAPTPIPIHYTILQELLNDITNIIFFP